MTVTVLILLTAWMMLFIRKIGPGVIILVTLAALMMLIASLMAAFAFFISWYSHHKSDYWDGVPASQQLDGDFWLGMLSVLVGLVCLGVMF